MCCQIGGEEASEGHQIGIAAVQDVLGADPVEATGGDNGPFEVPTQRRCGNRRASICDGLGSADTRFDDVQVGDVALAERLGEESEGRSGSLSEIEPPVSLGGTRTPTRSAPNTSTKASTS